MNRNTVPKSGRLPVQAISDTSALVLLWCGEEIYQSDAVRQYAGMLDLSRGRELLARCHAVWEEYDRVIRYRKLCIAREAETILAGGIFGRWLSLVPAIPCWALSLQAGLQAEGV